MEATESTQPSLRDKVLAALGIESDPASSAIRTQVEPPASLQFGPPRWDVIARIEDDRSDFRPEHRLNSEHFDQVIETFDSERRRVPWIAGFAPLEGDGQARPSHWSVGPPAGEIIQLSRDRINLWAKTRPIIDPTTGQNRMERLISEGYTERSVAIETASNETGGKASLVHVAALSMGEPPGISNMPRLDRGDQLFSNAARGWELLGGKPSAPEGLLCRSLSAANRTANEAEEEDLIMPTLEEIRSLMSEALAPISKEVTELRTEVTGLTEKAKEAQTKATAAEGKADDAETRAKAAEEEKAKAEREAAEKVHKALVERATKARNDAITSGRLPAKVLELESKLDVENLTERDVDFFETAIRSLPVLVNGRLTQEVRSEDGKRRELINPSRFMLGGVASRVDMDELENLGELAAQARGDDGRLDHDKLRALIYQRHGEAAPVSDPFDLA